METNDPVHYTDKRTEMESIKDWWGVTRVQSDRIHRSDRIQCSRDWIKRISWTDPVKWISRTDLIKRISCDVFEKYLESGGPIYFTQHNIILRDPNFIYTGKISEIISTAKSEVHVIEKTASNINITKDNAYEFMNYIRLLFFSNIQSRINDCFIFEILPLILSPFLVFSFAISEYTIVAWDEKLKCTRVNG